MKIAIYGAGALGTILGAYLAKAGIEIILINRNKEQVDALNQNGAVVTGETELKGKVRAIVPDEMDGIYDLIFLMTKQTENETVAEFLKDHMNGESILCTVQNGLPEFLLGRILGDRRVVGAAAVWGATLIAPGIAALTSNPDRMSFQIGSLSPSAGGNLLKVKAVLEHMCPVYLEENFIGARWSKLLINAAFSGLSTLFGVTFGEVAENKDMRAIAQRVIKETIDVAKGANIRIMPVQGRDIARLFDYSGPVKKKISSLIIPIAMKNHRLIRSGMLGDIERGRKTEVDAINGIVCSFAEQFHCTAPFNERIVESIHLIEEGKLSPSISNTALFADLM